MTVVGRLRLVTWLDPDCWLASLGRRELASIRRRELATSGEGSFDPVKVWYAPSSLRSPGAITLWAWKWDSTTLVRTTFVRMTFVRTTFVRNDICQKGHLSETTFVRIWDICQNMRHLSEYRQTSFMVYNVAEQCCQATVALLTSTHQDSSQDLSQDCCQASKGP